MMHFKSTSEHQKAAYLQPEEKHSIIKCQLHCYLGIRPRSDSLLSEPHVAPPLSSTVLSSPRLAHGLLQGSLSTLSGAGWVVTMTSVVMVAARRLMAPFIIVSS